MFAPAALLPENSGVVMLVTPSEWEMPVSLAADSVGVVTLLAQFTACPSNEAKPVAKICRLCPKPSSTTSWVLATRTRFLSEPE